MDLILIKRYKNRKLYLIGKGSRFLSTNDIVNMIQSGKQVQVIDYQGNDATHKVLGETIKQHCKNSNALHNFVRNNIVLEE
jgi:polyhydroxyalkanoate synthesis regulator protein